VLHYHDCRRCLPAYDAECTLAVVCGLRHDGVWRAGYPRQAFQHLSRQRRRREGELRSRLQRWLANARASEQSRDRKGVDALRDFHLSPICMWTGEKPDHTPSIQVALRGLSCFLLHYSATAWGQGLRPAKEEPQIQDNSFLVEEAYNQERGVVQHINTFSRMWNSKDWSYSFTQEWPAPGNWHHQLSYTLVGMHAGANSGTGGGMGDTIFNYRYQAIGSGESRLAFSPRLSLLLPTGNVLEGRGLGAVGGQVNLPVSIVLHRRVVTHWNIGGTFVPRAQNADRFRAS